ncbi:MAG: hybrid sensor histidine kinase/response regulator, partial [Azospira oryzae]
FQRLNTRELYEGTGIGLAIVKKVVERHDGIVAARGIENEGATFIIVLPLRHQQIEIL